MTTKSKTTWESTHLAATAIINAETQARDEKTARLKAARRAAAAPAAPSADGGAPPKGRKARTPGS